MAGYAHESTIVQDRSPGSAGLAVILAVSTNRDVRSEVVSDDSAPSFVQCIPWLSRCRCNIQFYGCGSHARLLPTAGDSLGKSTIHPQRRIHRLLASDGVCASTRVSHDGTIDRAC